MPFRSKLTIRSVPAWCVLALLALAVPATASTIDSWPELAITGGLDSRLDPAPRVATSTLVHLAADLADLASSPWLETSVGPAGPALAMVRPTIERNPQQDLTPLLANPPPERSARYPETRIGGLGLPGPERIGDAASLTERTHWGCELYRPGLASGYAFEVEADHTFLVAGNDDGPAVWVHNGKLRIRRLSAKPVGGVKKIYSNLESRRLFEELRFRNLDPPNNFPVIDRVNRRTARGASHKTIDLASKAAQDPEVFRRTVRKYVDKLRSFGGGIEFGGLSVPKLESRVLEIGVQESLPQPFQLRILKEEARRAARLRRPADIGLFLLH